ncbi:hypothetical protein PITCH_A860008 [uncultured Desulfobacterium sp.]|uniref:Uncharacterized protein n=1 Tax=uncultured Desulfobacterium sp. TaxID=201089 RepID=A0A445N3E4_9BACT|nr:hypothetical protein PITCH_A860008 [uncultured Desulfobacterium sp.]
MQWIYHDFMAISTICQREKRKNVSMILENRNRFLALFFPATLDFTARSLPPIAPKPRHRRFGGFKEAVREEKDVTQRIYLTQPALA